jgi:hypothetical protein
VSAHEDHPKIMKIIQITTFTLVSIFCLFACDPSQDEFDVDELDIDERLTDEPEVLLHEPDMLLEAESFEGTADPCDGELDIDAETDEQPVGLCWLNGQPGWTQDYVYENDPTGGCCGVGNLWARYFKRWSTWCCVGGNCTQISYNEKYYCSAFTC